MAGLAVAEFRHYEILVARLHEMGIDPEAAMAPFVAPIDAFHERTRPSSWLEGLVKAYVGDGIATDFYREIAAYVDPSTQALVHSAHGGRRARPSSSSRWCARPSRRDPHVAGRLALWGRRLVGEALSQAQQVAVERDALASLLVGGDGGPTGPAPTWPSSAGCSPGSPTSTPAGWAASAWPPDRRHRAAGPGALRRPASSTVGHFAGVARQVRPA